MIPQPDGRALLLTRWREDLDLLVRAVRSAGLEPEHCQGMLDLSRKIREGAALAVVDLNALPDPDTSLLDLKISDQPDWSDFPVILLVGNREWQLPRWSALEVEEGSAHLVVLQKPTNSRTLLSAIRSAHRSRLRQYLLRDQLAETRRREEELRESQEQLRKFNRELDRLVEERTEQLAGKTRQLQILANQLTTVEQQQRRQISRKLHDGLQQLLLAARMQLDLFLKMGEPGALEQLNSLLQSALGATRSLTYELSPPALYEMGLPEAVRWLCDWFARNHHFDASLEVVSPFPQLDETARVFLFAAIRELLLNAHKHSGVNRAQVSMFPLDGRFACVEVADEGRGFDGQTTGEEPQIKGFGLFSIRERLAALGGTLITETASGRGARFRMTLPVNSSDTGDATAAPSQAIETSPESAETSAQSQVRILIVDDHTMVREAMSAMLEDQEEFTVVGEASDGAEAVEKTAQLRPDLIIMDINMPSMNGPESTRLIRERFPEIKVVALSMHDRESGSRAMLDAGAAVFLPKDGPSGHLFAAIRELCGR